MNILTKLHNNLYNPELSTEEYKQLYTVYLDLYYYYRKKNADSILGRLSLNGRKKLHPLLLGIQKVKRYLGGFNYSLIGDKRIKIKQPIIYAVTHVGKFDIEIVSEAIKDHYYLLCGDYEHIQGTIYELFLNLNGVLYFCELEKNDRRVVMGQMISVLREGGNLMYFPEGAWNLSPNLPVLPCYWGIVDIAQKGNALIVPVAVEQYGKHFDINIGVAIDMLEFGSTKVEKLKAIEKLRDSLATLKWEIWEQHREIRSNLSGNEWERYLESRYKEWTYFSLDYVDTLTFKPPNVTTYQEAFAFRKRLIPKRENAFLIRNK